MLSHATSRFWRCYRALPASIQRIAVKQHQLWLEDPHHPSVQFKKVAGRYWSARVTNNYRALGVAHGDVVVWFWIGTHAQYDQLLGRA